MARLVCSGIRDEPHHSPWSWLDVSPKTYRLERLAHSLLREAELAIAADSRGPRAGRALMQHIMHFDEAVALLEEACEDAILVRPNG